MTSRPLRILFASMVFPKVSETFVSDQVLGLHRLGHDVSMFAARPGSLDDKELETELGSALGEIILPPFTGADPDLSRIAQHRVPRLHRPRAWRRLARVLGHPKFRQGQYPLRRGATLLDQTGFDAVLCHFGPAGVMMQKMKDIGLIDAPIVTIFHGYDITNYLERVREDFYDDLFSRGDLFLPISDRWRRRLAELGCPPGRTRLQRLGTNLDTFAHEFRLPAGDEPLRLMSVARLVEKKGIAFGIRAVGRLRAEGVSVRYDVIGDGPLRPELETLVRELDLTGTVNFLGTRSHEDVASAMKDHHVMLVPSVTDAQGGMEGIPVAIMEAMASGLLVVASEHSGIPEIVRHESNGLLAPERDDEALARELARIAADPPGWRRLVAAARDTVHQEYNLQTQNRRLAEKLAELTG